ncbi:MAG: guanylate kinase [Candidatus Liberibacter asiaticus]|nr:guanylate kinase [Candidatus Liberibacter asiaticus]
MAHIFVLIGASGVGKTTIAKQVVLNSEYLVMPVGVTTRRPRVDEKQYIDYRFISQSQFKGWKHTGLFIETTKVRDEYYGYLKEDINNPMEHGYDILLILTHQGLAPLKKLYEDQVTSIFIAPPSEAELIQRRIKRREDIPFNLDPDLFGKNHSYSFTIVNNHLPTACRQVGFIREFVKRGKKANYD